MAIYTTATKTESSQRTDLTGELAVEQHLLTIPGTNSHLRVEVEEAGPVPAVATLPPWRQLQER